LLTEIGLTICADLYLADEILLSSSGKKHGEMVLALIGFA